MINSSSLSKSSEDDGNFQISQIKYNNRTVNSYMIHPYGFGSNPPPQSYCITFSIQDDEANRATIACAPQLRPKNLESGESYWGNLVSGTYTIATSNGDLVSIIKNDKKVSIDNDLNITVSGDVKITVGGDASIEVSGNTDIKSESVFIDSQKIDLGDGGEPIARLGDAVEVDLMTGIGEITTASDNNRSA